MPQAIVDPEEIEHFVRELQRFNNELQESGSRLNARFVRLGDTWRDQEHQKFAQEYEQTMSMFARFSQASVDQIPVLLNKARIIREYLQR